MMMTRTYLIFQDYYRSISVVYWLAFISMDDHMVSPQAVITFHYALEQHTN